MPCICINEKRAIRRCERSFGFYRELNRALDYLPLTCYKSEFGHVQKKTVFYHSRNGIDLSGDGVGIFDYLAGAIENEISFIRNVRFTITSKSN